MHGISARIFVTSRRSRSHAAWSSGTEVFAYTCKRGFTMKNRLKLFGFVAVVAMIGLSVASCGDGAGRGSTSGGSDSGSGGADGRIFVSVAGHIPSSHELIGSSMNLTLTDPNTNARIRAGSAFGVFVGPGEFNRVFVFENINPGRFGLLLEFHRNLTAPPIATYVIAPGHVTSSNLQLSDFTRQ